MRFDPLAWNEVKPNEEIEAKGILRVRCCAPGALYIEAEGAEALFGVGTAFEVEVQGEVTWRVDAPVGTRVFYHRPFGTSVEASGEVFTNIDRMPQESEAVAEVTRARRMLEIERRRMIAEVRAEMAGMAAAARPAAPAAASDPASALVEDAAPEQEVTE